MAAPQKMSEKCIVEGMYGKTKVRVLRVIRHDATHHDLTEVEVECLLEGDFEESYTLGDNSCVVPTDTVKNTVYILSKESRFRSIEDLGVALCRHFIARHPHIHRVSVKMEEKLWSRAEIDGLAHDHVFLGQSEVRVGSVIGLRNKIPTTPQSVDDAKRTSGSIMTGVSFRISSGIKNLRILKSTQSGFENFVVDEYTSLQPTTDRIFCTLVDAEWEFDSNNLPQDFLGINLEIRQILLKIFSGPSKGGEYSKSVQETMYQMATETLRRVPQVSAISLSLPNIHHFLYDLKRFGLENNGTIFYPTDDPSGLIKCKVSRANGPIISRL